MTVRRSTHLIGLYMPAAPFPLPLQCVELQQFRAVGQNLSGVVYPRQQTQSVPRADTLRHKSEIFELWLAVKDGGRGG